MNVCDFTEVFSTLIKQRQILFFFALFSFFPLLLYSQLPEEKIQEVEANLRPAMIYEGQDLSVMTLQNRMQFYKIPAVSIVVINHGEIEWAKAYGIKDQVTHELATEETIFQAASISKPIAAMTALRLVQEGLINLDENVNVKLRSWRIPENQLTSSSKVSLRHILSHSSGLSIHGFRGYTGQEAIPTLLQILEGVKPANSKPIRVETKPGTQWKYSGGGFIVLQQLIEDLTALPFDSLVETLVLEPLHMENSTFDHRKATTTLATKLAAGHAYDGSSLTNKWFFYPERAAAGLWSTPTDLAYFLMDIQQTYLGNSENILFTDFVHQMLTLQIGTSGLGFTVEGKDGTLRFSHTGKNMGFSCYMIAYAGRGQGVVIMTNSDNGLYFTYEIMRSVAKAYGWPNYAPVLKRLSGTSPVNDSFVGKYQMGNSANAVISISRVGNQLFATFEDVRIAFPLYQEGDNLYFAEETAKRILFVKAPSGQVTDIQVSYYSQTPLTYRKIQ